MASTSKRATIYLDPELHKALRLKAAEIEVSMSDLVNGALKAAFREDAEDLSAIHERRAERSLSFEEFVIDLEARGKL